MRLTWKKPKRATYFNVQLYLGSKRVTQSWPKNGSFKIPRSKLKKGKTYTWYVWPGVGKKSAARYGNDDRQVDLHVPGLTGSSPACRANRARMS